MPGAGRRWSDECACGAAYPGAIKPFLPELPLYLSILAVDQFGAPGLFTSPNMTDCLRKPSMATSKYLVNPAEAEARFLTPPMFAHAPRSSFPAQLRS